MLTLLAMISLEIMFSYTLISPSTKALVISNFYSTKIFFLQTKLLLIDEEPVVLAFLLVDDDI